MPDRKALAAHAQGIKVKITIELCNLRTDFQGRIGRAVVNGDDLIRYIIHPQPSAQLFNTTREAHYFIVDWNDDGECRFHGVTVWVGVGVSVGVCVGVDVSVSVGVGVGVIVGVKVGVSVKTGVKVGVTSTITVLMTTTI